MLYRALVNIFALFTLTSLVLRSGAQESTECLPDGTFLSIYSELSNFLFAAQLCETEGMVLARIDNNLKFGLGFELLKTNLAENQNGAWIGIVPSIVPLKSALNYSHRGREN